MSDIAAAASQMIEALQKSGVPDERGKLLIPQEDEQAIFTLMTFVRDRCTVFTLGHEIHVKRSQCVV